jgi:hypothetical protein
MTIQLDGRLKLALQEREIKDIDLLSANEMFEEYCNWHGIINWADNLREVLDSARAYKHETMVHFEIEIYEFNHWQRLSDHSGSFEFKTKDAAIKEGQTLVEIRPSYRIVEVTREIVHVSVPITNKDR